LAPGTPPALVKLPPTYTSVPLRTIVLTKGKKPLIALAPPTRFQVLLALFQRAM